MPGRFCWTLSKLLATSKAVIVVGAQAVYLHTGTIDLGVPEFTIDADIMLDPALLRDIPEIEAAMLGARFGVLGAFGGPGDRASVSSVSRRFWK